MLHLPRTVSVRIAMSVATADAHAEVEAELRYDPSDPFAVTLVVCPDAESPVEWVFSRELLTTGLAEPNGEGDVTVEPVQDGDEWLLGITLATDSVASLVTRADRVAEFLTETYVLVPTGCEMEQVDIDAEIAGLLA